MAKEKLPDFLSIAVSRYTALEVSDEKVSDHDVMAVVEAGRWAPSSHNIQPWKFIVVRNRETITRLMDICYYGFFHLPPPVMIAVVYEPSSPKGLLTGKAKELEQYHQYIDIGQPVLNMQHEATSLGLDSFIVSLQIKKANSILKVPARRKTILAVGLGHPKAGAYRKPRGRKELSDILRLENYAGKTAGK